MKTWRFSGVLVLLIIGIAMAFGVVGSTSSPTAESERLQNATTNTIVNTDGMKSGIDGVKSGQPEAVALTKQVDSLSAAVEDSTGVPWRGVSVILALFVLVQTIVRITPTPKDDEISSRAGRFLNMLFNGTRIRGYEAEKAARSVESQIVAKLAKENPERIAQIARDAAGRVITTVEQYGLRNSGVPTISHLPSDIAVGAVKAAVENRTMRTAFGCAIQKLFARVI